MRVLTVFELPNIARGKNLKGSCGKVNRGRVETGRAGIRHDNVDGLPLPGNPDLLATVAGLGTGVSVGAVVEGGDVVVVRVYVTTGTSIAFLLEPGTTEIVVRK